jgi:hypothetical protein
MRKVASRARFMLVSCFTYSSTLKMEVKELFITTAVRT